MFAILAVKYQGVNTRSPTIVTRAPHLIEKNITGLPTWNVCLRIKHNT